MPLIFLQGLEGLLAIVILRDNQKAFCSVYESKKQGYVQASASQSDEEGEETGGKGSQDFDGAEDQASITGSAQHRIAEGLRRDGCLTMNELGWIGERQGAYDYDPHPLKFYDGLFSWGSQRSAPL
jgi:hypothetical protein